MNVLINLKSSEKDPKGQFHGGNEYANRICLELVDSNKLFKHRLYFFCHSEKFIDQKLREKINGDNYCQLIKQTGSSKLEDFLAEYNIDRLFDPLGTFIGQYALENMDVIYTIHGLRPIEMPTDINEYYLESKIKHIIKILFLRAYRKQVKQSYRESIELKSKSKKLIAVSEHTKYAMVAEFNIDPDDITVLYSPEKAYPAVTGNDEDSFFDKHEDIKKEQYYLIVSSKQWMKNTYRAIKAFDELIEVGQIQHKIILTGANERVKGLIRNPEMFYVLDYVETMDLEILYKNAFALVYPSLNEGFGYPPLEAMKYGTPVISAATTSIPEVVGEASMTFNPFSVIELKARLLQLKYDTDLRDRLSEEGLKRYHMLSKRQKSDLIRIVDVILS